MQALFLGQGSIRCRPQPCRQPDLGRSRVKVNGVYMKRKVPDQRFGKTQSLIFYTARPSLTTQRAFGSQKDGGAVCPLLSPGGEERGGCSDMSSGSIMPSCLKHGQDFVFVMVLCSYMVRLKARCYVSFAHIALFPKARIL